MKQQFPNPGKLAAALRQSETNRQLLHTSLRGLPLNRNGARAPAIDRL
jgi:hypothetical protein